MHCRLVLLAITALPDLLEYVCVERPFRPGPHPAGVAMMSGARFTCMGMFICEMGNESSLKAVADNKGLSGIIFLEQEARKKIAGINRSGKSRFIIAQKYIKALMSNR